MSYQLYLAIKWDQQQGGPDAAPRTLQRQAREGPLHCNLQRQSRVTGRVLVCALEEAHAAVGLHHEAHRLRARMHRQISVAASD